MTTGPITHLRRFSCNNANHSAIKCTPFDARYGCTRSNPLTWYAHLSTPRIVLTSCKNTGCLRPVTGSNPKLANAYQVAYANRRTRPDKFHDGNKVWMSTQHVMLCNQQARKFSYYIGLYPIVTKFPHHMPGNFACLLLWTATRIPRDMPYANLRRV